MGRCGLWFEIAQKLREDGHGLIDLALANDIRGQEPQNYTKSGKTLWTSEGRQAENAAMLASGNTIFALTTNSSFW